MTIDDFVPDFNNYEYKEEFKKRLNDRINFIKSRDFEKNGLDKLPSDALESLENVLSQVY